MTNQSTPVSERAFYYDPPTEPLNIVHLDDDLIIVNKPSGLLSVPGKAEIHKDCLETRLRGLHPENFTGSQTGPPDFRCHDLCPQREGAAPSGIAI